MYVLWRRERYVHEVEREMRFHLELASRAASDRTGELEVEVDPRHTFGNTTYYREEVRRVTPLNWFDRIRQDTSYAWRGLRRAPGFTVAVVLTLGLGIGVNAAVFSFMDRLFVRPPAGVTAPNEVRRIYADLMDHGDNAGGRVAFDGFSYPYFLAIAAAEDPSLELALYTDPDSTAAVVNGVRFPIRQSRASANYFRLLGVRPQRGRFFTGDEAAIESPTLVAVLSDAFLRRAYPAGEQVIGRTIEIGNRPYTVIGVASAPFTGIDVNAVDVWVPANTYGLGSEPRSEPWYQTFQSSFGILARIPRGVSEAHVTTAATTAMRTVHLRGWFYDSTQTAVTGSIIRANGPMQRQQEVSIATRLAGVAFIVLLIACANIANLLLVRATRRQREIALRRALGVSAGRLYSQLLTESLLLSMLAGMVGLALAFWAATALRRLLLPHVQWADAAIDLRTIAFIVIGSLVTGMVTGLVPAMHATRPDVMNSLKAGAREDSYQHSNLRSVLLVVQTALSVLLIAGAGLFVRSLKNVEHIDVGFDIVNTLSVEPVFAATPPSAKERFLSMPLVAERMRSAPGVEAAGFASSGPMGGYSVTGFYLPDRDSLPPLGNERWPSNIAISPGYFRATGVPLLAGRDFGPEDRRDGAGAVIVSRAMARLYWPNESAVGKCVQLGKPDAPCSMVVGVVGDVNRMRLIEEPSLQFYRPLTQVDTVYAPKALIVRTSAGNAPAVTKLASAELKRVFPQMAPVRARTIEQQLEPQFRPWRLGAQLFTALGLLALVVATIGVYSVVAYAVSQRTREMGIRLALGAQTRDILSLVVGEGSRVVLLGVVLGIAGALLAGRLIAALLFGVSARDPLVLAGTAVLLAIVGLVASALPGWRATRVDPVAALRAD